MGVLRAQRRIWTVVVSMQDLEDPESHEITSYHRLADVDASRLAIDSEVMKAAQAGVDQVLREHRKIMVGEE